MRDNRLCGAAGLLCATLLLSRGASAQVVDDSTRNAARDLAGQAKAALDRGNHESARDLFHRAYTLVPAPTLALYEARALIKLGRFVEAEEAYMRAVRTSLDSESPEPFRNAVRDAAIELGALRPRIPKVTLLVTGPGAQDRELSLSMDGKPLNSALVGVAVPIDPGSHVLTAVAPGGQRVEVRFSAVEKESKRVTLEVPAGSGKPTPAAPPTTTTTTPRPRGGDTVGSKPAPSSWQRPAGLVVGGLGVAGAVTGVVSGLLATSRFSEAERECPRQVCVAGSAGWDAVQSFRSLRTVSTIGYVVGGIGLAAGVTLFLTAPSPTKAGPETASVNVWVSASGAGLAGAF